MTYMADYQRRRRAEDPEYAERSRELSRQAKQRRRGICEVCGAETKYNGIGINGASRICATCSHEKQHEERKWTRERIIRAFQRFHAETGRVPRTSDKIGLYESQVARFSGTRIREMEQAQELGLILPPHQFVKREFGSWDAGLAAAGMPRSRGGTPTHRKRFADA